MKGRNFDDAFFNLESYIINLDYTYRQRFYKRQEFMNMLQSKASVNVR